MKQTTMGRLQQEYHPLPSRVTDRHLGWCGFSTRGVFSINGRGCDDINPGLIRLTVFNYMYQVRQSGIHFSRKIF